jgi:NTP pyrophosphatase (non-canonical NTP hydrolase)
MTSKCSECAKSKMNGLDLICTEFSNVIECDERIFCNSFEKIQPNIYQQLINKFGKDNQCIVAIEELSELQKEICKYLRGLGNIENLAEEIADVEIMLEQLKIIYACDSLVAEKKDYKINRIKKRYLSNDR